MTTETYTNFLAGKIPLVKSTGFDPLPFPRHMTGDFAFQATATSIAIKRGRCALFLDTGLGKTTCELEFARQAAEKSNGHSLILTPLAVARQIETEGERFGYGARVIREAEDIKPGISICNYDRLDKINPAQFGAVILDESSVLKNFSGKLTRALIETCARVPYKLAATATPAPNDHMELGQHAEFLGVMTASEMLIRWFINDTATASQSWRLKGHAVVPFWDWVSSWAVMAESPEDLGFDGSHYILPDMRVIRHKASGDIRPAHGSLFAGDVSAIGLHDIKRQTADARADAVAALVNAEPDQPWVVWCDTDYEADALAKRLPNAVEVRGSYTVDRKENNLLAFSTGSAFTIITKPSVAGQGLNWQHASRVVFVGRSFSYEAWYQAVRRCWRFGQTKPVDVHLIVAEGEEQIGRVIDRKAQDHATMKAAMRSAARRAVATDSAVKVPYNPTYSGRLPSWLSAA
jgi:hypothetical protein